MTSTANGKRQKSVKLFPSLISCVYSRVKLFVSEMISSRRYSMSVCFICGLEEKDSKSVIFAVCRLPSAVDVMLNLSNISALRGQQ